MILRRNFSIIRHNWTLLLSDPEPIIIYIIMPVIMMAFLQPSSKAVLAAQGYSNASGAEQVVPGMAVLFSFFNLSLIGAAFFREHGWGTWERLRASQARPLEILLGKCLPCLALLLAQMFTLFTMGWLLFGLKISGSLIALTLLIMAQAFCILGLAVAWIAVCRTLDQYLVFANLGGVLFSGLGGALAPTEALPDWARFLAPVTPAYWSLRGFKAVILDGADIGHCAGSIAMLLLFGGLGVGIAAARFRFADVKVSDT